MHGKLAVYCSPGKPYIARIQPYIAGMDTTTRRAVAENVRLLMEANGYSQKRLAAKTGVAQRSISNLLRPDSGVSPTLDTMERLSDHFGIPTWQLMLPGQTIGMLQTQDLGRVIANYARADDQGREFVNRVAEREATYNPGGSGDGTPPKTGTE